MHEIIKWVSDARAEKEIGPAMSFYKVQGGEVRTTNGRLTACYPWDGDMEFLVAGAEFEKVLSRMDDPVIKVNGDSIVVRSGRFSGTIATMPLADWNYPDVVDAEWVSIPSGLIDILKSLRVFIPDKPQQLWMGCVALEDGNCYSTNGYAIAGSACDVGKVQALLPAEAIDFVMRRLEGLEEWACNENYVAFRWQSGAWLRTQKVIGKFTEKGANMVRKAYQIEPTQEITQEFREAFADVAALAEDSVKVYSDRIEARFKQSKIVAPMESSIEKDSCLVWSAQILAPVISQATHWTPTKPPELTPFRGDNVAGWIAGRRE